MKNPFPYWLCLLGLVCAPALAAMQDHAALRATAETFVRAQTQSIPGQVSLTVHDLDARTRLPACADLQAFLPPGARLMGKTSVGVRCNGTPEWRVFLQAEIRIRAERLVIARPLPQGHLLTAADFTVQPGELEQPGILTEAAQAEGRTLKFALGAGQVLRQDMLRPQYVVRQGQAVKMVVRGAGYTVSGSGTALNDAERGGALRVKAASGQVIATTAGEDGSAEVSP